jgi:hypothetical protein
MTQVDFSVHLRSLSFVGRHSLNRHMYHPNSSRKTIITTRRSNLYESIVRTKEEKADYLIRYDFKRLAVIIID